MRVIVGVTPDAHEYRCTLDGVDVSVHCRGADDQEGWADISVLAADGNHALSRTVVRQHGKVKLWRPAKETA